MKDSKAVKLIALAHDQGYIKGYNDGREEAQDQSSSYETGERDGWSKGWDTGYASGKSEALSQQELAEMRDRAYDRGYTQAQEEADKVGYARGLAEGQTRVTKPNEEAYDAGLEAGVEAERERALAAEPKLQVWFKPCGPVPPKGYPLGINKLNAIKAIREAYDNGEGYGLKETKDLVEIPSYGARYAAGQPLPQSKAVTLYLALQAAGFDPVLRAGA